MLMLDFIMTASGWTNCCPKKPGAAHVLAKVHVHGKSVRTIQEIVVRRLLCAFATVAATLVASGITHADPKSPYDMGVLDLRAEPSGAATGILSNPTRAPEPRPLTLERSGVGSDRLKSAGKGRDENGGDTMSLSFDDIPEP
ncbi:MAG: hypothetical protein E4H19_15810, partial [Chromatiales bacterium]